MMIWYVAPVVVICTLTTQWNTQVMGSLSVQTALMIWKKKTKTMRMNEEDWMDFFSLEDYLDDLDDNPYLVYDLIMDE